MLFAGVLGLMAGGTQQLHPDLQRGVGQLSQQLGFCNDFGGHKIEDEQIERADVLMECPELGHDENIFAFENGAGGQGVGDLDGQDRHLRK